MADIERDLHILVSIAKVDASLNTCRTELAVLPGKVEKLKKEIDRMESGEKEAATHFEEMGKERRTIEQQLDDNAAKITKLKTQLMQVKTNKEYTAMLHEIGHIEKDIEDKEERLLILMDELDSQAEQNKIQSEQAAQRKAQLRSEVAELELRIGELNAEGEKMAGEKPALLKELDPVLKKRYDRILAKFSDYAVTNILDDICQGCFTRVTPQSAVEVRKNDHIITCEACGRMLVHYNA